MSDTFKLPEGILKPLEDTEEVVDEVIKDKDLNLQETTEEEPVGLDVLKEKGIISESSITGSPTEEMIRGISKIVDKVQGKEIEGHVC